MVFGPHVRQSLATTATKEKVTSFYYASKASTESHTVRPNPLVKKAVAPRKMSRNHWSQEYVGWLEIALIGVPNVVESPFNWESYRFRARALIGNLTG